MGDTVTSPGPLPGSPRSGAINGTITSVDGGSSGGLY